MINWQYADKYGEPAYNNAEFAKLEALVQIAEQLDKLNENLKAIKIPSVITTHAG